MIASLPVSDTLPAESAIALQAMLHGLGCAMDARIVALRGGANNRVYRIDGPEKSLFLKAYFRDQADGRDRLAAEFAFARLAWDHGIRAGAQPLAKDDAAGLALYEFITGRRLERGEVNVNHVEQALTFVRRLSTLRFSPASEALPSASEACFSIADHLQLVDRRVAALMELPPATAADRDAAMFIRNELAPAWLTVGTRIGRRAALSGMPVDQPLPQRDRCLSPSDFGFHNALVETGGRLRFVDFEYAGWDDPAKLVCDFFCQPAVPVPRLFLDAVASTVVEGLPNRGHHRQRIELLWPAYRIKWCCIMLNVFSAVGGRRRVFAAVQPDNLENMKKTQLALAREALRSLVDSSSGDA